jgi:hypothetical protein
MTRKSRSSRCAIGKTTRSIGLPEYKPSESQICQSFLDFVQKRFPGYLPDIIKIDNEGKTSWTEGKRKRREGKVKGASDYFIAIPQNSSHGLWLEIKTERGRESPEQKAFGLARQKRGYQYKCVYGIDEAMKTLETYLNLPTK